MINITDNKIFDFSIENYTIDNIMATELMPAGKYVRLCKNGNIMATNTPVERISHMPFVRNAHGDVLIAGLGIGYLIDMLKDRQFNNIKTITVIELYKEVIDLVIDSLPIDIDIVIINHDIKTFKPTQHYDTIYFDIWQNYNEEIYRSEMQLLMKKFNGNLRENGWIGCWAEDAAKDSVPWEDYLLNLKKMYML